MNSTARPVLVETNKIIETDDGAAIQQGEYIHTLNSSAFEILKLCDGNRTIDEIIVQLEQVYTNENLRDLVETCLDQLTSTGLVQLT